VLLARLFFGVPPGVVAMSDFPLALFPFLAVPFFVAFAGGVFFFVRLQMLPQLSAPSQLCREARFLRAVRASRGDL
jgi:hypothetical protein